MRGRTGKRFLAFLLAVVLCFQSGWGMALVWGAEQDLPDDDTTFIDSENFPDQIFRDYVASVYDLNGDGVLDETEKSDVVNMDISGMGIRSLDGISVFCNLQTIYCAGNRLSGLDVSALEYLECLDATWNQIAQENLYLPENWQAEAALSYNSSPAVTEQQEQETAVVEITKEAFPDKNFRKYVSDNLDLNQDGILSEKEQQQVTTLYVRGMGIESLEGVGFFPYLIYLNCENNSLTKLDLTQNPRLKSVYCRENLLSEVDGLKCPDLQEVVSDSDVVVKRFLKNGEGEAVSDDEISGNGISEDGISGNEISGNEISGNGISENGISQNGVSENEEPIEDVTPAEAMARSTEETPVSEGKAESAKPVTYKITFQSNGGSAVAAQTVVKGAKVKKPADPTRSKYVFAGWYNGSVKYKFTKAVTKNLTLKAKWTKVSVGKGAITKLTNSSRGVLQVKLKKVKGASGYQVQVSTSKTFKTKQSYPTTKTSISIRDRYKNKKYYVRVRAYKLDSKKNKIYGKFSAKKNLTISKGIQKVQPSQKVGTLKSVTLSSKKTVRVKATISNFVKSVDNYYYLFHISCAASSVAKNAKPDAKIKKTTAVNMTTPLNYGTANSKLQSKFVLAVKTTKAGSYSLICVPQFISNPEKLASYNYAFPTTKTKKGLQVDPSYISDAAQLGVKHTAYNICLDDVIATPSQKNTTSGIPYIYNGTKYWFNKGVIGGIDNTLAQYKKNGMVVSAILLLRWRADISYLIPAAARTQGHNYYAMNTSQAKARKHWEAVFTFLAQRYTPDNLISNWILGNEVNNYGEYHYTGSASLANNVKIYTNAYRLAYIALRSVYANARVYISLDQIWTYLVANSHTSKQFLDKFAEIWYAYGDLGNFNIAFHPYPAPLEDPAFWTNSKQLVSNSISSPCISMSNLKILTNYVQQKWGSNTRIILSELGFTSRKYGVDVPEVQAAAMAYAYYLAEFNNMVDAFILHRHVDHQAEKEMGLYLGLWSNDINNSYPAAMGEKKYAWEVFKYMDTSSGAAKTNFALKYIEAASWKSIVSGYNTSRFS